MASFSSFTCYTTIRCTSSFNSSDHNKPNMAGGVIKINGTKTAVDVLSISHQNGAAMSAKTTTIDPPKEEFRQNNNIPTKKQYVDTHRQGQIVNQGVNYRQTVVVRSYEVGPDKTVTIESLLNLLQETALNHVWMSGLLGDGFGTTHGMMRNNLIWVVSRMQVEIDHYPIWGEVVEIDTWVGASGKNGMRRDWLLRSHNTGLVFARATSTWVMMNEKTRRLSKMPEEVRGEIEPWFIDKRAITEENSSEKINKLDDKAKYVNSDLKPKRSDLDMNHHVNNVKYVRWMLETIPDEFPEKHQMCCMTLEYRRECGSSDVVESLCAPHEEEGMILKDDHLQRSLLLNGNTVASGILQGNGLICTEMPVLRYTHLLQAKGEAKNEEIVRGRTSWKRKT